MVLFDIPIFPVTVSGSTWRSSLLTHPCLSIRISFLMASLEYRGCWGPFCDITEATPPQHRLEAHLADRAKRPWELAGTERTRPQVADEMTDGEIFK